MPTRDEKMLKRKSFVERLWNIEFLIFANEWSSKNIHFAETGRDRKEVKQLAFQSSTTIDLCRNRLVHHCSKTKEEDKYYFIAATKCCNFK